MSKPTLLFLAVATLGFGFLDGPSRIPAEETPMFAISAADDGKCQAALDLLNLNVDTNNIVSSFRLPFIGQYNTSIAWASSNTAVIAIVKDPVGPVASVVRSSEAVTVTLTATATLVGSQSATKDFEMTVLKKGGGSSSEMALAMNEDFSSYESGIELSNYFKWTCSASEADSAYPVDQLDGNFNEMPSDKILKILSTRTSSSTSYTRAINVKSAASPDGAVLEGDFLVSGSTNGVNLEFLSNGSVVAGVSFSTAANSYYQSGSYTKALAPKTSSSDPDIEAKPAEEGVWEHFRMTFKPSNGRLIYELYDWNSASYLNLVTGGTTYYEGSGITSGSKGDVNGFRITALKGSQFGATYLANLKLDVLANLPKGNPTNHNRADGLGPISNFDPSLFAIHGQTISGLNPDFVAPNRFNPSKLYVKGTDYSLTTVEGPEEDEAKSYVYTFTLLATGETKTVTQTVYFSDQGSQATISGFKSSYLKIHKTLVNGSWTQDGYYLTLSGSVFRGDGTLHYLVLAKESPLPTSSEVISGSSAIAGYVVSGYGPISTHEFAFDSGLIPAFGEYDVYALMENLNGLTEIYASNGISTVVNIATCQDFQDMTSNFDTLTSVFRLTTDLDFSSYYWNFDDAKRIFKGTIDGEGHTVKNLTMSTTSSTTKPSLFYEFDGTIKNIIFENVHLSGYTDVGILGGNSYGCTVTNVYFNACTVDEENSLTGGDGYFGIALGRGRGGTCDFTNVSVDGAFLQGSQHLGLLVGGLTSGATMNASGIYASGTAETDGAHEGFLARNQGGTLTVTNSIIRLNIRSGKKEIGAVVGKNEVGGKVNADRLITSLKIKEMTQPTYFGQFLGSDANATGSGGKTFAYTGTNIYYVANDYSEIGDNIVPIPVAITLGTAMPAQETYAKKFWETKTFLRDLDVARTFSYDEGTGWPVLKPVSKDELTLQATDFSFWVAAIDMEELPGSHYALYKANNVYVCLSDTEKTKIPAEDLSKFEQAKAAYEAMTELIAVIGEGF